MTTSTRFFVVRIGEGRRRHLAVNFFGEISGRTLCGLWTRGRVQIVEGGRADCQACVDRYPGGGR